MDAYINLDDQGYRVKPFEVVAYLKKRVSKRWQCIDVLELADLVGNKGYTVIPGHLEGGMKAGNCTGMQLFMLDFDTGVTFQEIKERCEKMGLDILFAYHSFSSSETMERFRIAFAFEDVVTDVYIIKLIIEMLYKLFPECDASCKNLDRMYFGGKKLIYINAEARLALVKLYHSFLDTLDVGGQYKRNIRNFCNRNKIFMDNEMPAIIPMTLFSSYKEIVENTDSVIIHIISESAIPTFFVLEQMGEVKNFHQSQTCKIEKRKLNVRTNTECQLLNDFKEGEELHHNSKFALYTNLRHISGGEKYFFEILKEFEDMETVDRWENALRYMKGYRPKRCSSDFCPYYDRCENAGNIHFR